MEKKMLISGGVLAGLAVAFGAFGAHALKDFLTLTGRTQVFQTAAQYQFYQALALLALARFSNSAWVWLLLLVGTIVFSGSLYLLCLTQVAWLAAITPIGGSLMIAGWIVFVVETLKKSC